MDFEREEGVAFVGAWDRWMSHKLRREAGAGADGGADGVLAPGQQQIGADLFAPNGSLRRLAFPPTTEQSAGLDAAAEAAAFPPHAAHYGHEDVMALQFGAPPAPGRAPPRDRRRDVARLEFEDGSGCSCDADCAGRKYVRGCCVDWERACQRTPTELDDNLTPV